MKKAILFFPAMCFFISTFLNAQSSVPVRLQQSPPRSLEHKPEAASTIVPLYDSIYYWTFDTNARAWDYSSKEVKIVYNAGNKMTSQLVQNWDGTSWVNFTVDTFAYNANNLDTADVEKAWTGTKWENEYWYTYTYNSSDSETSEVEQIWTGSAWRNYVKFSYTYDVHNNKTNLLEQQWNGASWAFGYQYAFMFNANNLDTMQVDSTGASYNRWLYGYNVNNLLVTDTSQYWTGSAWATDFIYLDYYNANNLDTSDVSQQWTGSAWENYEKYTYTYDGSGNNIGMLYYNWSGSAWVRFQQYAYTYDANNFMLSDEDKQYFDAGSRVIIGDSTYWYFHKTTGIDEVTDKPDLQIYPNPSNGKFIIQINNGQLAMDNAKSNIEIYNELGQKVFSELPIVHYPLLINISNQPNGVYFVVLKTEQGEFKGKVVIQR